MTNSADPDQLASSEANWSGATVCKGRVYSGSAGLGLIFRQKHFSKQCRQNLKQQSDQDLLLTFHLALLTLFRYICLSVNTDPNKISNEIVLVFFPISQWGTANEYTQHYIFMQK